jgi:hypothetical protein
MTGGIGTLPAGNGKVDEFVLLAGYPDTGEGGVEDFVVGEGADQLTDPAPGALRWKRSFLENNFFERHDSYGLVRSQQSDDSVKSFSCRFLIL